MTEGFCRQVLTSMHALFNSEVQQNFLLGKLRQQRPSRQAR